MIFLCYNSIEVVLSNFISLVYASKKFNANLIKTNTLY